MNNSKPTLNLKPEVATYLQTLQLRCEPITLENYRIRLEMFLKWLKDRIPSKEVFNEWVDSDLLSRRKLSHNTIRQYRITIEQFFTYLDSKGIFTGKIAVFNRPFELAEVQRIPFTVEEYNQILAHVADKPDWKFTVMTAWTTGLRLSDIVLMKWAWVDLRKKVLTVTLKKTMRFNRQVTGYFVANFFRLLKNGFA